MSHATPAVVAARLRSLAPIDKLSQSAFRDLLGQTAFRAVRAGTAVFRAGENDDWTFYLLDGALELEQNAQRRTIRSGTTRTKGPLGAKQPRESNARAVSDCMIARVPTSLLDMLSTEPPTNVTDIEVNEMLDCEAEVGNQLLVEIYKAYTRENLEIPSLPDVAIKIRKAVEDPNASAQDIERIVTADPAVAARLVQVANSPAYGGTMRVESCRDAVTRLGFTTTREIVTTVVLKQVFCTRSPVLKQRMLKLWQHCTLVASICYHLGKTRRGFSPDRALLAGLIHDIGALPVLAAAQHHEDALLTEAAVDDCIAQLRGQIGALVLRQWEFPEDLVTVALEADDWKREGGKTADYCDLVLVAKLFSHVGTPEFSKIPHVSSVPAFERLTLGELPAEETLIMLDDARADIDELHRLLAN